MIFPRAIRNKEVLVNFSVKDPKLHSPDGLVQFCQSEKKIYSCLFIPNCTRKIMWLPIQIVVFHFPTDTTPHFIQKLNHSLVL